MYSSSRCGANAYARVGLETGILAASPHKLITMLFQGAHLALSSALTCMKNGQIAAKGEAISKAIAIINSGLQASLDIEAGGELAHQLNALYEYMNRRLLQANLHDEPQYIKEVIHLLDELSDAWAAIGSPAQQRDESLDASASPRHHASTNFGEA
jgi:flagellar protein FliS